MSATLRRQPTRRTPIRLGGPHAGPDLRRSFGTLQLMMFGVGAVDRRHGDALVLGSSPGGVLSRVFLGSHATRIVRHSPMPVVVVPA